MPIPVATALGRRDRMWPAVSLSAIAHALLVGWALVRQSPPPIDLEQKPIVAKLVRLGEKRPEEWLPRKEATPAPAAPPAPVSVPVAAPKAPAAPSAAAKTPPARPAASSNGRSGQTLASVLSRVQRQVDDSRYGDPDGDAAGDSAEGSAGDRYYALVERELRSNYRMPATLSDRRWSNLKAVVLLRIQRDGTIVRFSFDKPSGNPTFDDAVERAVRQTRRVPPPPESLRETFATSGLLVIFPNGSP